MGKETEPAKKLTLTLHLLTVETYMKKRDLKFDLAADRDRQERGGRDSRGGMRRGRQTLGTCFCGLFSAEWTLTGMSRGLTLSFSDHLVLMWKRKKEKEKKKRRNLAFVAPLSVRCHIKALDGCCTGCAAVLQLLLQPRSPQWQHESKCQAHCSLLSPQQGQKPRVIRTV